jgi:formate hydrogenlyase subunit 6/NADH:ubiquinone oxidoreductase subunit I
MRIGAMIGDISRSLFKRPITERYPFERKAAPERLRGQLMFDATKCSGCKVCVRDCPAIAIELFTVDKATKRFVLQFHSDRCTYCAQCVVSCNFDALIMSHEKWELAGLSRDQFVMRFGRPEDLEALANPKPAAPPSAAPPAPATA